MTTGQPHTSGPQPPRPRYNRPSEDVIETFKRVFIQSMQSRKDQSIGAGKAEEIVSKAIRRVLEPDFMANIPPEPQEEAVTKAFEKIVVQSQGPPRQTMPGQQSSTVPTPAIASSAAATAAMTAAASAGASNGQTNALGTKPSGDAAQPEQTQAQTLSKTTSPQQQNAPTAPMHQQPQPQRPAESVLMNMLMAGPGQPQSGSPAVPPQTTALNQSSVTKSASPVTAVIASTSTVPVPADPKAQVDLAKVNGVLKDLPQIQAARANGTSTPTRPAVEPLTPPVPGSPMVKSGKRVLSPQRDTGSEGKRVKLDDGETWFSLDLVFGMGGLMNMLEFDGMEWLVWDVTL
jgi:hypothetical protein